MEEILRKLQKDASGSKHKAIKESCTWALGKRAGAAGHLRPSSPAPEAARPGLAGEAPVPGRTPARSWVAQGSELTLQRGEKFEPDFGFGSHPPPPDPLFALCFLPNLPGAPLRAPLARLGLQMLGRLQGRGSFIPPTPSSS